MVRAQTRTDDDARGSHLSIPGIRIFRMNGLHRCVNNNANRFHRCVRADSKPPVSDVCLRSMDSMLVASTTIPSTRRKRRSNGDICYRCLCFSFSFFFFGTISDCKSLSLDRSSRLCSLTIAIGKLFFFRIEKFVEKLF